MVSGPYRLKIGGRTLKLPEGRSDVGRSPDCWLIVEDDLTSRAHARFHVEGNVVELEDLDSRNGTFVNGEQLAGRTRHRLRNNDRLRIGREILTFLGDPEEDDSDEGSLRQTIGPGEDSKFPSLIGALVEKSLSMGKLKEAERYALALTNQLASAKVGVEHPVAESAVNSLIALAEKSTDGVWLDRVFLLHCSKQWVMQPKALARIRDALDSVPRVPGSGLADYEKVLRNLAREGQDVPPRTMAEIGELVDAYSKG